MNRIRSRVTVLVVATALLAAWLPLGDRRPTAAAATPATPTPAPPGTGWPRLYKTDGHSVLLYQPQVDAWENHARIVFRTSGARTAAGRRTPAAGGRAPSLHST